VNELALFSGAGGSLLAGALLGWRPICAIELDPYCRRVLLARQRDGLLPRFPIWDDVPTFNGTPWRGYVDVISGGVPCQDISKAAGKRAGISGARSGLWAEFARILGEVRPRYAFIENSAELALRGLDRVLSDLAALGMDARWCCLGADDVGAPHIRKRLWILAYAHGQRREKQWGASPAYEGAGGQESQCGGDTSSLGALRVLRGLLVHDPQDACLRVPVPGDRGVGGRPVSTFWETEPAIRRVVDGMAHRVDRLKALGNGWVPQCAAAAWHILHSGLES
jgi:DNA (cytosine-5)-methyltransferase 1